MCKLCRIAPCPDVKRVEFFDNDQVKRVEFYRREIIDDVAPESLGALSDEIDARWAIITEWMSEKKPEAILD